MAIRKTTRSMISASAERVKATKPFRKNKLRRVTVARFRQPNALKRVCSQWYAGSSGRQSEWQQTGRVLWYCGSKTLGPLAERTGGGKLVPWRPLRGCGALQIFVAIRRCPNRPNFRLANRLEARSYEGL